MEADGAPRMTGVKVFEAQCLSTVIKLYLVISMRIIYKAGIFSIHYFFAEGKKVKGMVRNGGRGRGGVGY